MCNPSEKRIENMKMYEREGGKRKRKNRRGHVYNCMLTSSANNKGRIELEPIGAESWVLKELLLS